MTKIFLSEQGCQKSRGGNLAPPWCFSNPFGPLERLRCLLFTGLERSDHHWLEVGQKNDKTAPVMMRFAMAIRLLLAKPSMSARADTLSSASTMGSKNARC